MRNQVIPVSVDGPAAHSAARGGTGPHQGNDPAVRRASRRARREVREAGPGLEQVQEPVPEPARTAALARVPVAVLEPAPVRVQEPERAPVVAAVPAQAREPEVAAGAL